MGQQATQNGGKWGRYKFQILRCTTLAAFNLNRGVTVRFIAPGPPILTIVLTLAFLSAPASAQRPFSEELQTWLLNQGYGDALRVQQVNVFGDGNPANGTEDNRIDMSSPEWNSNGRWPWNMGAGTIHCDGKMRGSAMIVDTREFAAAGTGLILATSAHVLYDLHRQRRFGACQFHYMALDHLPGYRANIDFKRSRMGDFDPSSVSNSPLFGKGDWAFLYVSGPIPGISDTGNVRLRSFHSTLNATNGPVRYQFIAYSPATDSIVISTQCEVRESASGDLGGGSWRGQLLDNCDSEGGASGGGLVATAAGNHYLVGIRSGAHWDSESFPQRQFPNGPPDGARWDVNKNTNFSRAIDGELIDALRSLLMENNGVARIDPIL